MGKSLFTGFHKQCTLSKLLRDFLFPRDWGGGASQSPWVDNFKSLVFGCGVSKALSCHSGHRAPSLLTPPQLLSSYSVPLTH